MRIFLLAVALLAAAVMPAGAGTSDVWLPSPARAAFPPPALPSYLPDSLFRPALLPSLWTPFGLPNLVDYPARALNTVPSSQTMRISIVRSDAAPCAGQCAEWISAEGRIDENTPQLFRMTLALLGKRKLPVVISSIGGSVGASFAIGQMIRIRGVDVVVGRTVMQPCPADDKACTEQSVGERVGTPVGFDAVCESACVYVLAAGVHRIVPPHGARIGVHETMQTHTWVWVERIAVRDALGRIVGFRSQLHASQDLLPQAAPAGAYVRAETYLTAMGIDGELLALMHQATFQDMRLLTDKELDDTGLATQRSAIDDYFAQSRQRDVPATPGPMPLGPTPALTAQPTAPAPSGSPSPPSSKEQPSSATACPVFFEALPVTGRRLMGLVEAVIAPEAASVILRGAEESTHVQTDPKYFGYERVGIRVLARTRMVESILVPPRMAVKPGDIVTFVARHRDPALRCHFVPNLAVSVRHS